MVASNLPLGAGIVHTPLGSLHALSTPRGLCWLSFGDDPVARDRWIARHLPGAVPVGGDGLLDAVAAQLHAYFDGTLRRFTVPLDLRGTPFQIAAWQALCAIPYGSVRSYAQHAAAIDRPRAVRAVGAANGANPIAIIVPCHRLIGSDGALVKYGGGLALKQYLLALEGAPEYGDQGTAGAGTAGSA